MLGTISRTPGGLLGSTRSLQRIADQAVQREGSPAAAYARLARGGNAYLRVRETGLGAQLAQPVELSWRDAWMHEVRNAHGEWTRGPGDHGYEMPDPERLVLPPPKHPRPNYYERPEDHPFFKANPVSPAAIIDAWSQSSPQEREQGMRWYQDAHALAGDMAKLYLGGNTTAAAGTIAAYSPQTGWAVDMMNALASIRRHKAIGPGEGQATANFQHAAQQALDGVPIDEAFHAPKTNSFAHLIDLGGDAPDDKLGEVVIDRWALSAAMARRSHVADIDKAPIGITRYHEYVSDQYRAAARVISEREGREISPHQVQAVTWLHTQGKYVAAEQEALAKGTLPPQQVRGVKGRATAMRNARAKWLGLVQSAGLHVAPGTTGLAMQMFEMLLPGDGIGSQILDLAFNPAEPRDPHGRWTRGGTALAGKITEPIGDEGARGNSRAVSHDEFQAMAAEGRDRLRTIQSAPWSTDGMRQHWAEVKARTFAEVQKSWGGATIDPRTGQELPQGADKYAMSIKPSGLDTTSVPETASPRVFSDAMDAALAKYGNQLAKGGSYLGVFHDDDLNRIDIDPVTVLGSLREVETVGAYTHAIGGAYHFASGDGFWPPHVPGGVQMSADDQHWDGPGQWHSHATAVQQPHDEPDDEDAAPETISGQM